VPRLASAPICEIGGQSNRRKGVIVHYFGFGVVVLNFDDCVVRFRPRLRVRAGGTCCSAEGLLGECTQGGDDARGTRLVLLWAIVLSPYGADCCIVVPLSRGGRSP